MKKLYIVRHGETEWNKKGKTQGMLDSSLTDLGIIQANRLANRLSEEKINHIYTSDLSRAHDTANIISKKLGLKLNVAKELREMNFGCWQGLTKKERKANYPKEHIVWHSEPHKASIEGAETLLQVKERTLDLINRLKIEHRDENVLLVSHGSAIKTLILGILGIDLSHYKKIAQSNTALNIIEFREHSSVITLLNDTNHLREV
ncbi:histidine phosphatase family protein [Sporosalibacterium faouarense]|uniref:histidine phosphatase family protein n=1 Tax=Sporosalibacterium faouarense TaxID=516123 RepID=UPI00141D2027|nr:histidine phosphatase family protein [Sporosalibacterium faouarense]MTI48150.1 histidine phosphatase family protein [Bacillota bacterium]